MCGRIESSVCCSSALAGKATFLVSDPQVPALPPETTALPADDGTHKNTLPAAWAEPAHANNTATTVVRKPILRPMTPLLLLKRRRHRHHHDLPIEGAPYKPPVSPPRI